MSAPTHCLPCVQVPGPLDTAQTHDVNTTLSHLLVGLNQIKFSLSPWPSRSVRIPYHSQLSFTSPPMVQERQGLAQPQICSVCAPLCRERLRSISGRRCHCRHQSSLLWASHYLSPTFRATPPSLALYGGLSVDPQSCSP